MDDRELAQRLDTIQQGIDYIITLNHKTELIKEKKPKTREEELEEKGTLIKKEPRFKEKQDD